MPEFLKRQHDYKADMNREIDDIHAAINDFSFGVGGGLIERVTTTGNTAATSVIPNSFVPIPLGINTTQLTFHPGEVVGLDSNGQFRRASGDKDNLVRPSGIMAISCRPGQTIKVVMAGFINAKVRFTVSPSAGDEAWLAYNNPGKLTNVKPVAPHTAYLVGQFWGPKNSAEYAPILSWIVQSGTRSI